MAHSEAGPVDCRKNAHLVYRRQCNCCDCILLCLARMERPGERPATIFLVQNHFEVVPLSHLGATGRSLFPTGDASRSLRWRRLSDIYSHTGVRTKFCEKAINSVLYANPGSNRAPQLNCSLPYPSATLNSLPLLSADVWSVVTMPAIKFRGVDFIAFDSLLSDDERLVRDTARKFIEDNLIPIIEECNRAGRFPRELVKPMADLGFFGASLQGYGCAGMSNVEYGLVTQELERGDSGVRSFVSVQSALVMYPIYAFGSDEQKNTWLPAMQKGEKLGCFGLTEPDFGSNPGGMRTRAKKRGNEYVLNGEKMWITSGTIADVAVIWAKVEDEDDKIRGFLV